MSRVQQFIQDRLDKGPVHVTLIDPDKQSPDTAKRIAVDAEKGGTHIFLIGGTTGVDIDKLGTTIRSVRSVSSIPIIIFPTAHDILSCDADAVFFMSLMNSNDVGFVMREAVKASMNICDMDLEPLSVGYLVFAPGMTVGKVGNVDLIQRDDLETARKYAKSVEMFGMSYCYLEGGSGVSDPIPSKMISAVSSVIDIPLIIGGGIRDPASAREVVMSGADIVVTGNLVERNGDIALDIRQMISAMEEGWRERS